MSGNYEEFLIALNLSCPFTFVFYLLSPGPQGQGEVFFMSEGFFPGKMCSPLSVKE